MKIKSFTKLFVSVAGAGALLLPGSSGFAQGTAFTYQGRLNDGASPATGSYDLRFALFDGGGIRQGPMLTNSVAGVSNGLFTVTLDFGPVFDGNARLLEVAVRTNGNGGFIPLVPRQPITPAPFAIFAAGVASGGVGGVYSNTVTFNNSANGFSGAFHGDGTGLTNLNASQLATGAVPDARLAANVARTNQVWLLGGNAGTSPTNGNFLGTVDNQPFEMRANGLRVLRVDAGTNQGTPSITWGPGANVITPGVIGSVISGGGMSNHFAYPTINQISSDYGAIGGGYGNFIEAASDAGTIAGGTDNVIFPGANSASILGGSANWVRGDWGTIAGGYENTVGTQSQDCVIGGGFNNSVDDNAISATIPGGSDNFATSYAFAAGRRAMATNTGAFVWADSQDADFTSTASNQFLIRAGGGVGINTTNPASPLTVQTGINSFGIEHTDGNVRLATFVGGSAGGGWLGTVSNHRLSFFVNNGSASMTVDTNGRVGIGTVSPNSTLEVVGVVSAGAFAMTSDRALKENFTAVNPREMLDKVTGLPITRWNFKSDAPTEHIGPMAQDFRAAFGLGTDDKHIATVDADGVALAAIQGLNQKLEAEAKEKDARIAAMEAALAKLQQKMERFEASTK